MEEFFCLRRVSVRLTTGGWGVHRTHLVAHLQGRDDECRTLNADIAPELLADDGGEGVDAGVCEGQGDLNLRAFGEEGAVERDAWGELGIRIVGVEEGGRRGGPYMLRDGRRAAGDGIVEAFIWREAYLMREYAELSESCDWDDGLQGCTMPEIEEPSHRVPLRKYVSRVPVLNIKGWSHVSL